MRSEYKEIPIDEIKLDLNNPRIAKFLEIYGESSISGEAIALALGGGTDDKDGTSYSSLKESIKTYRGIIHPIIVNCTRDNEKVVIEGNTRVQIYREFKEEKVPGNWDKIRAIVYYDLTDAEIHAIRLQSHLVGPRDWDPYSKGKYLNYLCNIERLPIQQIISFCGGKTNEVRKLIDAYNDMEKYYRAELNDDSEFDQREYSKFVELQNKSVIDALLLNKYSKADFAKWVVNGNIDTAQNVRALPLVLKNKEATEVFLKSNISEAKKVLAVKELNPSGLKDIPYEVLASELIRRFKTILFSEVQHLKHDVTYEEKRNILFDLQDELNSLISAFSGDD